MIISKLVKELAQAEFEVVKIEGDKVEVKRLWSNGKGYQRETFQVTREGMKHLKAYENSNFEMVDIIISDLKIKDYIKEQL